MLLLSALSKANFTICYLLFGFSAVLGGIYMWLRSKVGGSGLNLLVYVLVAGVVFALSGLVQLLQPLTDALVVYFVLQGVFFLAGFVHAYVWQFRRDPGSARFWPDLLLTLFLAVVGLLLYSIVHTLLQGSYLQADYLWAGLAFLLPYLSLQAILAYMNVPDRQYRYWMPPSQPSLRDYRMFEDFAQQRWITIAYTVELQDGDGQAVTFKRDAPLRMTFAHFFFQAVKEHNKKYPDQTINVKNAAGRVCGWWFERKAKYPLMPNAHIDFDRTLEENKIHEFDTILFKRAAA